MRSDHPSTMSAVTTPDAMTQRHDPNSTRTLPSTGARMGARKKAVWTSVITRAMAVPSKRSRTMACVRVREPADANPHTKRLA